MKFFTCTLLFLFCFSFQYRIFGLELSTPASLSVLVEEASSRDGKPFSIEGELIGEPLNEENGIWLNLSEEGNFMAVFCPTPLASMASTLAGGNHQRLGCRIRTTGTLRRICPDHGGDLDFHASAWEVMATWQPTPDSPEGRELLLLGGLLLGIFGIWLKGFRGTTTPSAESDPSPKGKGKVVPELGNSRGFQKKTP